MEIFTFYGNFVVGVFVSLFLTRKIFVVLLPTPTIILFYCHYSLAVMEEMCLETHSQMDLCIVSERRITYSSFVATFSADAVYNLRRLKIISTRHQVRYYATQQYFSPELEMRNFPLLRGREGQIGNKYTKLFLLAKQKTCIMFM